MMNFDDAIQWQFREKIGELLSALVFPAAAGYYRQRSVPQRSVRQQSVRQRSVRQ
jgi:hypothetical protein